MRGKAFIFVALVVAASCGGKIGDGADAGGDGSSDVSTQGQCCPMSSQPGCCMSYGGYAEGGGCSTVCDGMPSPNDPGWHQSTDAHGCPIWVEPTNPQSFCGPQPPPPVDAGGACPPQSLGAWSPQVDPPFFAHANVCSTQLIAELYASCFDANTQNQSNCQALMTQNPTCQQCLITPRTASKWGAMLSLANGLLELDVAGCIADSGDVAFDAAKCSSDGGASAQCFVPTNDFQTAFELYATLFCGP